MKIRFKKLRPNAVIPAKAHPSDACFDLVAAETAYDNNGCFICYTGLAVEIPEGYVGHIYPRSSVASKDLLLTNCVGVIDAGYRGEITAKFKYAVSYRNNASDRIGASAYFYSAPDGLYRAGDRFAQLSIDPVLPVEWEEADELSDTERGRGGYGSTGA